MKDILAFLKFLFFPLSRLELTPPPVAEIQPVANHYGLFINGTLVEEYSRKRDAFRGAERKGYNPVYVG